MFRTVRTRIVALTALVVITSVVLTAVMVSLAVQRAARQEAARSLSRDASIYQALLDHGRQNATWDDVAPLVQELAIRYERRIALRTEGGRTLVDSDRLLGLDSGALRANPEVVFDPLRPLTGTAEAPTAEKVERSDLKAHFARLNRITDCLLPQHLTFVANFTGEGPDLEFKHPIPNDMWPEALNCLIPIEQPLSPTDAGLGLTMGWLQACLRPTLVEAQWINSESAPFTINNVSDQRVQAAVTSCVAQHRESVTAPPVQLYLGSAERDPLSLRGLATLETGLIAGCIIAVAGVAGVMLAARIVRPLRLLTDAATQLGAGDRDVRVDVSDRSEIGQLAETFNSMAESLDRSERARRQLIADIAHELGNPMVTIGGGLEAIQDGIYEPTPEVIASLAEEANQLQRLVTDLRELALADMGNLPIGRAKADLGEVVAATVAARELVAKSAGVDLLVELEGTHIVMGDETRLRQVVANLLANAIQHTPAGGTVTVKVATLPEVVRLQVIDTGQGIQEEHLSHIFERFWRADPSRNRDGGRAGLGLAISDALIRAQGGTISVASTLGEGTIFTVELPKP